jgi:lysophospholipase L1-like esterase
MRANSCVAPLVVAPFALCTALALRAAFDDSRMAWVALAAASAGLAVYLGARSRSRRGLSAGLPLSLALLTLLLAVPELGLRSAGFRRVGGVEFGYPSPEDFLELEPDAELFWTLPRGAPGTNSLGFAGSEPAVPKPEGVFRALFLGDSCMWQGHPEEWPALATAELATLRGRPIECTNLSLAGYSTHQGLRVAQRYGATLAPDLVVVGYGWNDHWLARGSTDSDKVIHVAFERVHRASRLLQLVASWASASEGQVLGEPRVSAEKFGANLANLVRSFHQRGLPVMLVTAPSVHDLGVPEYLLKYRFASSAADVVRLHAEYVAITREVARAEGVSLLDLEVELAARADRASLFLADGIHFTEAGRRVIAESFVQAALRLGLVP